MSTKTNWSFSVSGPDRTSLDLTSGPMFCPAAIEITGPVRPPADRVEDVNIHIDGWCSLSWASGAKTDLGFLHPYFIRAASCQKSVHVSWRGGNERVLQKIIAPVKIIDQSIDSDYLGPPNVQYGDERGTRSGDDDCLLAYRG